MKSKRIRNFKNYDNKMSINDRSIISIDRKIIMANKAPTNKVALPDITDERKNNYPLLLRNPE
jgi:hypothetical protein